MAYPRRSKNLSYTYTTRSFSGEVVIDPSTGKKRVKILHMPYYQTDINRFEVGTKVSVCVTNRKPKRTEAQNRYYWGAYLPMIAEETGEHDLQRLHALFKQKFLSRRVSVLGEAVIMERSTRDLSTGEFSDYIANIYLETGVMPPPADQ